MWASSSGMRLRVAHTVGETPVNPLIVVHRRPLEALVEVLDGY